MKLNPNLLYLLAIIGVIGTTILIDSLFIDKPKDVLKTQLTSLPAKPALPPIAKPITLAQNLTLPPVPQFNKHTTQQITEHTQQLTQVNKVDDISQSLEEHNYKRAQAIVTKTQEAEAIGQHLDTMSSLNAEQLTLRFPPSRSATQIILQYMHNCVGIDIGAIKNNSLMRLSDKVSHESQILRLVSGEKTQKEIALLNAYAKGLSMVRIYPHSFDNTFAAHVFNTIGTASLTQLSGEYKLRGQKLSLTNISINQLPIKNDWLLANIQICRA